MPNGTHMDAHKAQNLGFNIRSLVKVYF